MVPSIWTDLRTHFRTLTLVAQSNREEEEAIDSINRLIERWQLANDVAFSFLSFSDVLLEGLLQTKPPVSRLGSFLWCFIGTVELFANSTEMIL